MGEVKVAAVGALVALGALLTGCSVSPGDAAIVGDRAISQAYLDEAVEDLSPLLTDPSAASVLSVLVVAPTFIAAASEHGVGVSDDEALELLESSAASGGLDPVPDFGEGARELAQFSLALQNLQGLDDGAEIVAQVQAEAAALEVDVNPRYAVLDPATGQIAAVTPPWIFTAGTDTP
ncbi:MAG TPA: hypothetical protein VN257_03905 [Actinotalea sp.]|nr:hypothetical protein [Actinotalea sp.]